MLSKKRSSDLAADLKGRQFGRLKVLEYAGANQNGPLWRCQCSCGKMIVCGADNLRRGKTRSCGCFQEESRRKNMANAIHFVNGTCVEKIRADHRNGINSSNRSGYRGVYQRENGKWRAEISFQGKRHNLGTFESVEDAKMARITAENNLWGSFLKKYEDGR